MILIGLCTGPEQAQTSHWAGRQGSSSGVRLGREPVVQLAEVVGSCDQPRLHAGVTVDSQATKVKEKHAAVI